MQGSTVLVPGRHSPPLGVLPAQPWRPPSARGWVVLRGCAPHGHAASWWLCSEYGPLSHPGLRERACKLVPEGSCRAPQSLCCWPSHRFLHPRGWPLASRLLPWPALCPLLLAQDVFWPLPSSQRPACLCLLRDTSLGAQMLLILAKGTPGYRMLPELQEGAVFPV